MRSPVALALGLASVATLTDSPVDLALGASSPAIVTGWHDRPWDALPTRMGETVLVLRRLFAGERADFAGGTHVRFEAVLAQRARDDLRHLPCRT